MSDRIKWCIEAADQQVNRISSSSDARAMCVAVLASNALISEAIDRLSDAIRPPVVPLAKAPRVGNLEPIISNCEVVGWQRIDEREMKNARIKELGEALMVSKGEIADLESVRIARDARIGLLTSALDAERNFSKRVQIERNTAQSELASTKNRLADLEVNYARESDERRYVNAELARAKEFISRVDEWRKPSCGFDSAVWLVRYLDEYIAQSKAREIARNGPDADAPKAKL